MTLLAIDTATTRASIALHDGVELRSECTWEAANRHTVTLTPRIQQVLEASDLTPADLAALAVCIGPGSYTGVRIGVAAAKGMAEVLQIPLIGISTLDILVAAQPKNTRPLYAIFAAGRKRMGYACYRWHDTHWQTETDVAIATWAEFAEQITESAVVVGEISAMGRETLLPLSDLVEMPAPARHLRRAGFLADLAWERLRAGQIDDAATLKALYAR